MVAPKKLGPSEFEGDGVHPFGSYGTENAWEKRLYTVRTGLDPNTPPVDLDAPPDDFPNLKDDRFGERVS